MTEISDDRAGPPRPSRVGRTPTRGARVLDLIRSSGAISRVELARPVRARRSHHLQDRQGADRLRSCGAVRLRRVDRRQASGAAAAERRRGLRARRDAGLPSQRCRPLRRRRERAGEARGARDRSRRPLRGPRPPGRGDRGSGHAARAVDRSRIIGLGVATSGRRGSPLGWVVDASFFDAWEPIRSRPSSQGGPASQSCKRTTRTAPPAGVLDEPGADS